MDEKKTPPRRASRKDRINRLLEQVSKWQAEGMTGEEAIGNLTAAQYDFLIDCSVDLDSLLLTEAQQVEVKKIIRAPRSKSPDGYKKPYAEDRQALYNAVAQAIEAFGGVIEPRDKCNFRDLDFTIGKDKYNIILQKKRK